MPNFIQSSLAIYKLYSTMNNREHFNQIIDNIKESGGKILSEDMGLEFTQGEREYFESEENFSLTDEWFDFFKSVDGIQLLWKLDKDETETFGCFLLTDFGRFQENDTENKLWCDWYEEDDIAEMKKHRIVERLHGDDAYITVKFDGDQYNLYFVDGDLINFGGSKELPKLPLTITQYVKIITAYFGVYSLRYHLHKEDFYSNPKKYISEYNLLKKEMKNFVPVNIR